MLFNSYIFIFGFLPITVLLFYVFRLYTSSNITKVFLIIASLFYYSWFNPSLTLLILISMLFNYYYARFIVKISSKRVLGFGIGVNLAVLCAFKYTNFFIKNINWAFSSNWPLYNIVLPLAISFFTFQQIAYLVDTYRDKESKTNLVDYLLFITFFPQLIAGPIVYHKELIPQFQSPSFGVIDWKKMSIGITFFIIGLFKKVILADELLKYVNLIYNAAERNLGISCCDAWIAMFSYGLQIYFDFSGYCDMAMGLGLLFGMQLPLNFNSPYKALNIIDFWRRWHMTLSVFLRDYLYIPLGGNRKGSGRRYLNLMLTMLLGGFWHGANWTFVIWGGVHGLYLCLNHAWIYISDKIYFKPELMQPVYQYSYRFFCYTLTFFSVCFAWIFFRSESLQGAIHFIEAMLNLSIIQSLKPTSAITNSYLIAAIFCYMITFLPNAYEILIDSSKNKDSKVVSIEFKPSYSWAFSMALLLSICFLALSKTTEFIYFQF